MCTTRLHVLPSNWCKIMVCVSPVDSARWISTSVLASSLRVLPSKKVSNASEVASVLTRLPASKVVPSEACSQMVELGFCHSTLPERILSVHLEVRAAVGAVELGVQNI